MTVVIVDPPSFIAERRSGDAANGLIGFGSLIGPVYGRFLGVVKSLDEGDVGGFNAAFDAVLFRVFAATPLDGPACKEVSSSWSSLTDIRELDRRVGGVGVVGYSLAEACRRTA